MCLRTIRVHNGWLNCVCYSPDGKKALSAAADGTIKEWPSETSIVDYEVNMGGIQFYYQVTSNQNREEIFSRGNILNTFINEMGLLVQSCDFRYLHPSSHFTEEEKERLRRYGAIFNDEDERRWKEAVEDAYGEL